MKPGERVVFVPETSAFGGGERVLLSLSRFLHERTIPHRFGWYYRTVDLARHATWPVREEHLEPERKPLSKVRALDAYLHRAHTARSGTVLLVGIQAALHAGFCHPHDYSLLILDTPSLLSSPAGRTIARCKARVREQLTRPLIRRAMRRARSVIVTTDYMAREVSDLYGHEASVIRQGVRAGSFKLRPICAGEPVRLLSVCRLEPNKRVDWILHALACLDRTCAQGNGGFDWELDLVGGGSEWDALRRLAFQIGIEKRVHFRGRVHDEDLETLYQQAHLFLMPARQGYGLPALEALSRGLPVVAHSDSGVSEILGETPWVELMEGNVDSLADAIRRIVPPLRSGELAGHSLPRFPSENDWAETVSRHCGWL